MSTAIDERAGRPGLRQRVSAAIYDRVNAGLEDKLLADRRRELLQAADAGCWTWAPEPERTFPTTRSNG